MSPKNPKSQEKHFIMNVEKAWKGGKKVLGDTSAVSGTMNGDKDEKFSSRIYDFRLSGACRNFAVYVDLLICMPQCI